MASHEVGGPRPGRGGALRVLIYFDADAKARVVGRLLDRLAADGYMFLGHAETLTGLQTQTQSVGPTVYRHAGRPSARPPHVHARA